MSYSNIVDQLHLKGGHLDLGTKRLLNVEYPTGEKDGVNKKYVDEKFAEPNMVSGELLQPSYHWVAGESISQGNALAIGPRYNTLNNLNTSQILLVDSTPVWNGTLETNQGGFECNNGPTITNLDTFSICYSILFAGNQDSWESGQRHFLLEGVGGNLMNQIKLSYHSVMEQKYQLHFYLASTVFDSPYFELPNDLAHDTRFVLTIVKSGQTIKVYNNEILLFESNDAVGNEGINDNSSMKFYTLPNGGMLASVTLFNETALVQEQVKELTYDFLKFRPSHFKGIKAGFYSS